MVADALSRKYEDVEAFLCALSITQPDCILEAREKWKNDPSVWTLIQQLQKDPSVLDTFAWIMIHYGIRIAYISVRNPNSNKRCFWNYTPLR
jgi:hypothetical protein